MLNEPLISVVTVSYRAEKTIEKTIKSVLNQSYQNIQYVLKDGMSDDRTNLIINKYEQNFFSRGVSVKHIVEPDHGIYNAMNQALKYCEGEYVIFLNADDVFYSDNILEEIFSADADYCGADIIYGDADFVDGEMHFWWKGDINTVKEKCPFCHQSSFVKTSWMRAHLFDENLMITADYDFIYKSYIEKAKFYYVNIIISQFMRGGASGKYLVKDRIEHRAVQLRYGKNETSINRYLKYYIRITSAFLQEILFKYLPESFCVRLRQFSKKKKMRLVKIETNESVKHD